DATRHERLSTHRGFGRNEILAPEEPNVYSTVINRNPPALQRSAMFSARIALGRARFAPLERRGILVESCFYKHFVPTGRGTKISLRKRKGGPLSIRSNHGDNTAITRNFSDRTRHTAHRRPA